MEIIKAIIMYFGSSLNFMYNLFISHSWGYSDAYCKLLDLLNEYPRFEFRDYSVPVDDPLLTNGTDRALREAIAQQMESASCVLVLAGVYASYSKWIDKEIDIAKYNFFKPKKIIAIRPWGAERISNVVSEAADIIVGWNAESIVDAIRS